MNTCNCCGQKIKQEKTIKEKVRETKYVKYGIIDNYREFYYENSYKDWIKSHPSLEITEIGFKDDKWKLTYKEPKEFVWMLDNICQFDYYRFINGQNGINY